MTSIIEISGGVLLYLYKITREDPRNMDFRRIVFRHDETQWQDKQTFDEFQTNLLLAASNNQNDLYNAIQYLGRAGFITYIQDEDSATREFRNIQLEADAFRLIEGVEREEASTQRRFNITFNFKLDSIVNIDSILKSKFNIGLINA